MSLYTLNLIPGPLYFQLFILLSLFATFSDINFLHNILWYVSFLSPRHSLTFNFLHNILWYFPVSRHSLTFYFLFTRHSLTLTFLHNILWYFPFSPKFSDIFLSPWHALTLSFLHDILWHSSFHAPIQPFFLFQPDTLWFNLSL